MSSRLPSPPGDRPTFSPSFPLVEAKLHPPAARAGTIRRARQLERLLASPRLRVASVIGPPGYGKTLLLAELAEEDPGPVAWLSLDDIDNDPSVFLAYIAAIIDRIQPIDPGVSASLTAHGTRILASTVPRLSAELHRWPTAGTIILDDVHRLVDRTCLDALTALIDHLPAGSRVVLAGRTEPDLPFARFRANRDLLEIKKDDLALDVGETAALVAAAGRPIDRAAAAALADHTEGWAAGIYLSTLARTEGSVDRGGASPTLHPYVADYLWSELLGSLEHPDLVLLTRISIVEIVEPGVAAAVVAEAGVAARLTKLARSIGLIARVGTDLPAYRLHPLLRAALRAELARIEPGLEPTLHRRAAEWYVEAGQAGLAIEHAFAGGDVDLAASLVTAETLPAYYGGHADRLIRWLGHFDDQVFGRHRALASVAAIVHAIYGQADAAEHLADVVDRPGSARRTGKAAGGRRDPIASIQRALLARDGLARMVEDAEDAVAGSPPGSRWRYFALYELAAAHLLQDDRDTADDLLADAVEAAVGAGNSPHYGLAVRAGLAIERGDWGAAADLAQRSRDAFESTPLGEGAPAIMTYAVVARVAIHAGDLPSARQALVHAQVVRVAASRATPWVSVHALLEIARAYVAIADIGGARHAVAEAEQIIRRRPDLGILAARTAELRRTLDAAPIALAGASTLTPAELRLLPLLSTPLTFREIGERMFLSQHTVKTQAISIYGKLGASSRSEAVEQAIEIGLLEPFPGVPLGRRARTRSTMGLDA